MEFLLASVFGSLCCGTHIAFVLLVQMGEIQRLLMWNFCHSWYCYYVLDDLLNDQRFLLKILCSELIAVVNVT